MDNTNYNFPMAPRDEIPALPVLANIRNPWGDPLGLFPEYPQHGLGLLQVPNQSLNRGHTDTLSNTSDDPNPSLSRGQSHTSSTSSFTASRPVIEDQAQPIFTLHEVKEGDDKLTTPQLSQGQFQDQFSDPYLELPLEQLDQFWDDFGYLFPVNDFESQVHIPRIVTPDPEPLVPGSPAAPPSTSRQRRPLGSKKGKVAGMRRKGACVRCRIRKVECDEKTPCENCVKYLRHYPQVCKNQKLFEVRFRVQEPGVWIHDSRKSLTWLSGSRPEGPIFRVSVSFEQLQHMGSPLNLVMQQFGDSRGSMSSLAAQAGGLQPSSTTQYCLPPDRLPSPQDLVRWSEEQLNREGKWTFQQSIGAFLSVYANCSSDVPQKDLVCMVHQMRCWHKIWQCPTLWSSTQSNQQAKKLSDVAHLQLKTLAKNRLIFLERQVFEKLDSLLQVGLKPLDVPIWASFWQLILLYRDLLALHRRLIQEETPYMLPTNPFSVPRDRPRTLAGSVVAPPCGLPNTAIQLLEDLHGLLIVNYAAYFRNNSPAYLGMKRASEVDEAFKGDNILRTEFDNVRSKRRDFQKETFSPADALLKEAIIDHEIALDIRRGIKKK